MMKKLVGWIVLLVIGNVIWLLLDKNPPAWDQAAHVRSIILTNQWLTGRFWGNGIDLVKAFGGYPPLIYFIGGLWSLISGVSVAGISLINTLFLVAGVVGVYKLAGNKILPAVIFSLFPVIYDISRNMLLDLALTVWVVWGLYFWLKKNDVGILVMLILASLTKLNGFIYFLPMVVFYLWEARKSERMFLRLVTGGLIYLLAVGWWWGVNWQNIFQYLTGLAGQGEKLTDPMNLLEWQTWWHYFRLFFLNQVGPIVAIVFLLVGKKENRKLVWWTIATYVVFTVIKNKDFRFTMPLLMVVAVWTGWGLAELKRKWLVVLVLIWMGFNYIENSYNWPIKKPMIVSTPTFLMGNVNWIDFSDYPVREVRSEVWPQREIVGDLETIYAQNQQKTNLLVLMNREELNDNNLSMYKELWDKNMYETGSVGSVARFDSKEQILTLLKGFGAILVPEQTFDPAPFYGINLEAYKQVRDYIWANKGKYEWIAEYQMPKYGKVYLVRPLD